MGNRYFAVNSLAGMSARTSAANVSEDTTSARFSSTFVSNSIAVKNQGEYFEIAGPFIDGSTSIGASWLRFDLYQSALVNGFPLITLLNAGANAYRILATSGTVCKFQYWNGSAWTDWGSTFTPTQSSRITLALHLVPGTSFELYQNGTTLLASSSTTPTGSPSTWDSFRGQNSGSGSTTFFSQIMCADYDIRDSHMNSVLPTANGNYTDGTGSAADVAEVALDDGTAISLPAVGNKRTLTKTAIPTLGSGLTITSLVVNARLRVGGGTVTDGKIKCRNGSTDATSSGKSVGATYSGRMHEFTTSPDTGLPYTKTTFDTAEVGLEAA
jgi:hypothetical protein